MSMPCSTVPPTIEELTNEDCYSDNDYMTSQDQEECDMFFSCADWETQIKSTPQNLESEEPEAGFMTPSAPANKRLSKLMEKMGCNTDPKPSNFSNQFDVDLVMKKSSTTSKLLSKRSRTSGKPKQVTPKKALKIATKFEEMPKEAGNTAHDDQPFKDLCLSPMGMHKAQQSFIEADKDQSK